MRVVESNAMYISLRIFYETPSTPVTMLPIIDSEQKAHRIELVSGLGPYASAPERMKKCQHPKNWLGRTAYAEAVSPDERDPGCVGIGP